MPNDKNDIEITNGGGPKKADIIIKNTLNIAAKQEDLSEQTKLAVSRLDEAIELFSKNNQDATYIVKQSGEIFTQLQGENSALKQELLYLAKQSENIYAGLAEKITELSEQAKTREDVMTGFADRINDIAEQTRKSEDAFSLIADKLTELSEQNKRSEEMFAELSARLAAVRTDGEPAERTVVTEKVVPAEVDLTEVLDKLNALSEQMRRNEALVQRTDNSAVLDKLNLVSEQLRRTERAYADLSDRVNDRMAERTIIREKTSDSSIADISEVLDKITRLSEQVRRSDSAHSMLADKFEILSMRVEQYAFESAKNPSSYTQPHVAPVVVSAPAPAPAPVVQTSKEELDYDKLAEKVASLISAREVISPDYIASKVAEQIVIPEAEAPNVNVSVDADYIASKVVERISVPEVQAPVINIDGEEIADKVAQRLGEMNAGEIAASSVEFDEDGFADMLVNRLSGFKPDEEELAQRIAEKLDATKADEAAVQTLDLDEEELAERIARKLETVTVKAEESPVNELDEDALAERLAEKLGGVRTEENVSEAVIDEEELAERIARKIGVYNMNVAPAAANVNLDEEELADAISLKVGSLKAEDFEILVDDEGCSSISKGIADSLDYNMISNIIADKLREALDLAAVNAPDYEEMAERISEKITVAGINEDAIADKAAAVLSNYLPEFDTDEIADKLTGAVIDVVSAMPQPTVDSEAICNSITERLIETQEDHDYDIVIDEDGISKITDLVTEEIERETNARFDKVEEDIAKLSDVLAKVGDYVDEAKEAAENIGISEEAEESAEEDYARLSEVVAAEIEKGTASRFDKVEEDIARLAEMVTPPEEEEEPEEDYDEYDGEDDYTVLSEVVATEIEKGVSARLDSLEENIAKITEIITAEDGENAEDCEEEDYSKLSEVVAAEIEKGVSVQLNAVADNIAKITDYLAEEENEAEDEEELAEEEPSETEESEEDYSVLSEAVASEVEKRVSYRLNALEENIARITEIITAEDEEQEEVEETEYADGDGEAVQEEAVEIDYTALSEVVAAEIEKGVSARLDSLEEKITGIADIITADDEETEEGEYAEETDDTAEEAAEEDYSVLSEAVASEVEKRVAYRLEALEENVSKIHELITAEPEEVYEEEPEEEYVEEEVDYTELSEAVASEVERRVSCRLDSVEENLANTNARFDSVEENFANTNARFDGVEEGIAKISELVQSGAVVNSESNSVSVADALPVIVAAEIEKGVKDRLDNIEENIAKITEIVSAEDEVPEYEEYEVLDEDDDYAGKISAAVAGELEKRVSDRLEALEENVSKIHEIITAEAEEVYEEEPADVEAEVDYTGLSEAVASEVEKRVADRLDALEENVSKIHEIITAEPEEVYEEEPADGEAEVDYTELSEAVASEVEKRVADRLDALEENVSKIHEMITAEPEEVYEENPAAEEFEVDYTELSEAVANEVEKRVNRRLDSVEENIANTNARFDSVEENIAKISGIVADTGETNARFDKLEENLAKISELVENSSEPKENASLNGLSDEVREIKALLAGGAVVAANEAAAAQTAEAEVEEEEQELVTVSDLVEPEEEEAAPEADDEFEGEEAEEGEEEDDFLIDVLDMDAFSDDELMPGELSDYSDGVDFANMMKFKRSFIARIIQSSDDNKQYYGEVKHALLSYRKVNSNVAWGAERFNKGRETIARMKIRGKTLCLYLALDPNNYKVSVYHHLDVSDNKSVAGTPMMVKVKSPLGVRKAIRLIDEMLALRNGEKREIPERDYAAMYPYETIEELIDDGLVKDVRKDK